MTTTTQARKPRTPAEPPPDALVMAPTTKGPPPLEQRFLTLPLDVIEPNPNNPRRDLGDLDGLVASIRALGILEPLLVELIEEGSTGPRRVFLLAGHRRLAAARLAELSEAPCIVRTSTRGPAERLEMALVENLQREGLAPLDEADGYRSLVELGLSQRAIAERVGCSQSHVSKRLQLLELPKPVQARVAKGTLPLEVAAALVRLKDHPDKLKAAAGQDPSNIAYAVERAEKEIAWEAKRAELVAVAEDKGWPVVHEPGPHDRTRSFKTLARWGYNDAELALDVHKHAAEPCHAVMVPTARAWPHLEAPSATSICTEPARHGPRGASKLKVKQPPKVPEPEWQVQQRQQAKEREEQCEEAAKARRAVLAKGVAEHRNTRGRSSAPLTMTLRATVSWAFQADLDELACELLGVQAAPAEEVLRDYADALDRYAGAGEHELHRAALAVALADVESDLRYGRFDGDRVADHYAYLATLGYQPSPYEQRKLDEALEAAEAGRAS